MALAVEMGPKSEQWGTVNLKWKFKEKSYFNLCNADPEPGFTPAFLKLHRNKHGNKSLHSKNDRAEILKENYKELHKGKG